MTKASLIQRLAELEAQETMKLYELNAIYGAKGEIQRLLDAWQEPEITLEVVEASDLSA